MGDLLTEGLKPKKTKKLKNAYIGIFEELFHSKLSGSPIGHEMNYPLLFFIFSIAISLVMSRPTMQRIRINNHLWEVPNEPGWKEVIQEAEMIQRDIFSSCKTAAECRRVAEAMREIFLRYPVSKKYLENTSTDSEDVFSTIFKWG